MKAFKQKKNFINKYLIYKKYQFCKNTNLNVRNSKFYCDFKIDIRIKK